MFDHKKKQNLKISLLCIKNWIVSGLILNAVILQPVIFSGKVATVRPVWKQKSVLVRSAWGWID